MADYIYLLQTRLTAAQQAALAQIRNAARERNMTVFLVGGAVRDLTSGSPIRDLDVAVQGNSAKLRKDLAKGVAKLAGENEQLQASYFQFPGGVRVEVGSTVSVSYPKPGKPSVRPATMLEDLRRRDFTANAMAISLNEGSYGLLMDPLNGVADIENLDLRLVTPYGFTEDPARLIRATRLSSRLGWQMEERTAQRYETAKEENYIASLSEGSAAYELEEIFHEEDPLRVMRRLETEGWLKVLNVGLSPARVNEAELSRLRDMAGQLQAMGIFPDPSAAYFPLLTARMAPKDVAMLTARFARPAFAEQIAALEGITNAFSAQLSGKLAAAPSEAWKMLFAAEPEAVLWLVYTSKNGAIQGKFKSFLSEWGEARQKIPYQLMQEMRITPDLPGYEELLETLFFAIMDAKLETPEAARAFLEPYSPPAPPLLVNLRRRAVKRESKVTKSRAKKAPEAAEVAEGGAAETGSPARMAEPVAAAKAAKPAAVRQPASKAAAAPAKAAVKTQEKQPSMLPAKVVAGLARKAKTATVKKIASSAAVARKSSAKAASAKSAAAKKTVKRLAPGRTRASSKAKPAVLKKTAKTPTKAAATKHADKKSKPVPKAKPTPRTAAKGAKTPNQAAKKSSPKPAAKKTAPRQRR